MGGRLDRERRLREMLSPLGADITCYPEGDAISTPNGRNPVTGRPSHRNASVPRGRVRLTHALVAIVGATVVATSVAVAPPSAVAAPAAADLVTQLIVTYEPGVTPSEGPGIATGDAAVMSADLQTGDPIGLGMRTVTLGQAVDEVTAQAIADELTNAPGVLFAEPDSIVTLDTIQPSAPWGLDRVDQPSLPLDGTYQYATSGSGDFDSAGSGVKAYVIDTGILATHVDFGGRVISGYDGIGDGNQDCNGHGTHVAGTIGGTTYGVAKAVTLVPVRVFGCSGSTTVSAIITGINWVIGNHTGSDPAVANMSLSSSADASMDTAVNALIADGVTVAVASGNDNVDACTKSPARVPSAITVNASTSTDTAAYFSDFGSCSDIYAPGVGILSAWYTSTTATNTISGTSMASPHVAGAAARVLGVHSSYTPAQVWSTIDAASTNIAFAPSGSDPDKLLFVNPGVLATTPDAPRSVSTIAGNTTADVMWLAPMSNGGTPITSYTASAYMAASGGGAVQSCTPSPATDLTCTITGLTNGTTYYVDVVATNIVGPSAAYTPRVTTSLPPVLTVPTAPQAVTPSAANASSVVAWTAPTSNGGSAIQSYTARAYEASSGGSAFRTCQPNPLTALTCTITGLTNGTTYYVDAIAHNAQGDSTASTPRVAVTPALVATAPQSLSVTAGNTSVAVAWAAPSSNGGSAVTSYTAHAWTAATYGSIASSCQPSPLTALTCTITGLTNDTTYYVDVVATNGIGTGPAPAARVAATPVAPAPPAAPSSGGGSSSSSSSSSTDGGGGGSIWTIKEVRPSSGSTAGGTRILVLGWGFTGATGAVIGGAPATEFTLISDATIELVTPPGTAGWQELRVWLPNGSVPGGFLYVNAADAVATPGTAPTVASTPATTSTGAPEYLGPASAALIRPSAATIAATGVITYRKPLARSTAAAATITGSPRQVLRLGVRRLPASTLVRTHVLIMGTYYLLGRTQTTRAGAATLPAFQPTRAGAYLLRITPPGARPYFLRISIR